MNNKMKNSLALIIIFSIQVLCLTLKLTVETFEDSMELGQGKKMWHPHLSRDWIDESNFRIADSKRNFEESFPIFLEIKNNIKEKNEDSSSPNKKVFNSNNNSNNKMKCACNFVKENDKVVHREAREKSIISSIIKNNEKEPEKNSLEIKKSNYKKFLSNRSVENNDKGKDNKNINNNSFTQENINSVNMKKELDNNLISDENHKIDLPKTNKDFKKVIENSNEANHLTDSNKTRSLTYKENTDLTANNQVEEIQRKYLNILNDIRVDQVIPEVNFQNRNLNSKPLNSNLRKELNLMDINNNRIRDLELKTNSNISKLSNLNSFDLNGLNNFILGNDVNTFQPLDINNYRLKELNSKILSPNDNVKNPLSHHLMKNNINFPFQGYVNSEQNPNNYFRSSQNEISNYRPFLNNPHSNQIKVINNKINSIPNSNNSLSNDVIYKNILDYLVYNNQIINNIQKLLLVNSANKEKNVDNVFTSNSKIFYGNENKKAEENNEDFYLLNKILTKNKDSDFNFLNPRIDKQIMSSDFFKSNSVISIPDTPRSHNIYDPIYPIKNNRNLITNKNDLTFSRRISNGNEYISNINGDEYNNSNNKSFDGSNSNLFSLLSMNYYPRENENNENFNVKFQKNGIFGK